MKPKGMYSAKCIIVFFKGLFVSTLCIVVFLLFINLIQNRAEKIWGHNVRSIDTPTNVSVHKIVREQKAMVNENDTPIYTLAPLQNQPKLTIATRNCFQLSWNIPRIKYLITQTGGKLNRPSSSNSIMVTRNVYMDDGKKNVCGRLITRNNLFGRTGNQLFMLASLIGFACEYDYFPVILKSTSSLLEESFDLPNVFDGTVVNATDVHCIGGDYGTFYNCSKELLTNVTETRIIRSHNYMQSWKYFDNCKTAVREAFRLKTKHVVNAKTFLLNVSTSDATNICIHVRRGDMTRSDKISYGYNVANESFIEKAKEFYQSKYKGVKFIIISDDIKWCKLHIKGDIVFSPFTNVGDDLALMASCNHVVVTSGTFGWWGAWLSGGTTVYYKDFIRERSALSVGFKAKDYYPAEWIPM